MEKLFNVLIFTFILHYSYQGKQICILHIKKATKKLYKKNKKQQQHNNRFIKTRHKIHYVCIFYLLKLFVNVNFVFDLLTII